MRSYNHHLTSAIVLVSILAGCGNPSWISPDDDPDTLPPSSDGKMPVDGSILGGPGGLDSNSLFGAGKTRPSGGAGNGIGVNAYVWRATLDTLSFLPLISADPFGGVIITDWYAPQETPNDRLKLNVYILDQTLSSESVKVAVFRQRRSSSSWVEATVKKETSVKLENQILVRARQLRIAAQRFSK